MRKIHCLLLFSILFSLFTSSCSHDDDAPYPNLITEMADLYTDEQGMLDKLVLDNNTSYEISNRKSGYHPKALYRVLCDFLPSDGKAEIYRLTGAYILRDSTSAVRHDPVTLRSAWRSPRYINLHLAAKTQGGTQYFGFAIDSIVATTETDGTAHQHAYLSLHHNQNGDPTSYTGELFASLPLDSLKDFDKQAPITLRIHTFDGKKTFEL